MHEFDFCIAKNEEALQIDPHFAECYGNMANAWKVDRIISTTIVQSLILTYVTLLFLFTQEKGNIDIAIRYYLIAIEVCAAIGRASDF